MRQTWVLRNGGFQLGGQKRPGRARERRRELLTTIMGTAQEKEKERKRTGRGGTRVGATRKKREGRACQLMLEREECEGVASPRGATGGQKRGRNECRRSQKGRKREARACIHAYTHVRKKGRK
jgi:hypothetical protein